MAEGPPIQPESPPLHKSPVTEPQPIHTVHYISTEEAERIERETSPTDPKFYMVHTTRGMRDIRTLLPRRVTLSPRDAIKVQLLQSVDNALQTEEQIQKASTSQLTDILTEQETQRFTAAMQGKDIIVDAGDYFQLSDQGIDVLSKLPPQKRDAVFVTTFAKYYLKKKKEAAEAQKTSAIPTDKTQDNT